MFSVELCFSNQDGSDGFEWPSGAVSDQVLGITFSLLLSEAQPTLALPTSTAHSLPAHLPPHFQHRSWILPKEAAQLLGVPRHTFILGEVSSL